MREILFRGKRLDNGEWVEGYPLIDTAPCSLKPKGACVCPHDGSQAYIICWDDPYHEYNYVDVIPDTIGQYTGLTDKNGVKIFEGDLIEYDSKIFEMKYIDGFAAHDLRSLDNMSIAPRITTNTVPRMKVIGNIHDNPELLKGGESDACGVRR